MFEWIADRQSAGQDLPNQGDLRELFGGLTEDVDLHLQALVREGLVIVDKDGGNGLSLVPTYTPAPQIKLLGQTARKFQQSSLGTCAGSIALDLRGIGVPLEPGMFAVQVLDDRMIDAGIEYGDIALLVNATPMRGDIVAVEEAEVLVLRRYVIVSGIPHFLAENSTNPDLRLGWESPMHGVLWGLVRADPCRRHPRQLPTDQLRGQPQIIASCPDPTSPKKKKPKGANPRRSGDWPKPPGGAQLNETRRVYKLTEDRAMYDTWGPMYPSGNLTAEANA